MFFKKKEWFVDVPNSSNPSAPWITLGVFDSKKQALTYVKNELGISGSKANVFVSFIPVEK